MVLEVEPVVGADRRFIELALNPVLTEFDGFVNFGSPINVPQQVGLARARRVGGGRAHPQRDPDAGVQRQPGRDLADGGGRLRRS